MKSQQNAQFGFGLVAVLVTLAVLGAAALGVQQVTKTDEGSVTLYQQLQRNSSTTSEDHGSEDVQDSEKATDEMAADIEMEFTQPEKEEVIADSGQREVVTLAGGCFWCTEAYIQETEGVVDAVSGYAGGAEETATYKQVSSGKTNHREAVQVTFDPVRISFAEVLEVYWKHIDPTDAGGQFADRGPHYETAIFYHTENQRQTAEFSKQALAESGLFDAPIATEILPFTSFYKAEEYHQDYYQKAADHYERYKKASGRSGFIDDNWAKDAALLFFEEQAAQQSEQSSNTNTYIERAWTAEEIAAGLETLSADVYRIVAKEGTEPAFKNEYYDNKEAGIYVDVVTGRPLYSSTHKYESGTGWPAFYRAIDESALIYKTDYKLALPRTEVRSESGHLGHVFNDGPAEYGGKRHCINSLALNFIPKSQLQQKGYGDYLYLFE